MRKQQNDRKEKKNCGGKCISLGKMCEITEGANDFL